MTEPVIAAEQPVEPELRKRAIDPKGVLQKNLKPLLYLGVALLVILAAVFSSHGKKTPAQVAAEKSGPPQPMVQDNTDNNIQDLKNQLDAERQGLFLYLGYCLEKSHHQSNHGGNKYREN